MKTKTMTMTKTMTKTMFAAMMVMAVGACGGDGGSSGGGIAIGDLSSKYATAICTRAFQCCTSAELATQFGGTAPTDVNACITEQKASFNQLLPAFMAAINAGKMTYNGDKAQTCLDATPGESCATFSVNGAGPDPACNEVFVGKVAVGADCSGAGQLACVPNSTCSNSGTMATCEAELGVGGDCTTAFCQDGLYCDATSKCAAKGATGATCNSSNECESDDCSGTPGTCSAAAPTCTMAGRLVDPTGMFGHPEAFQ